MTTDDMLLALATFGRPSLHRMERGWWCRLELRQAGAEVKIDSETNHAVPHLAVLECGARLREYMESMKEPANRPVWPEPPARLSTEEV